MKTFSVDGQQSVTYNEIVQGNPEFGSYEYKQLNKAKINEVFYIGIVPLKRLN